MNSEVTISKGKIYRYRIERRRKHPCAETRSRARQRHWNLTLCKQKVELKNNTTHALSSSYLSSTTTTSLTQP